MRTASTRSNRKKGPQAKASGAKRPAAATDPEAGLAQGISERAWLIASISILAVAALFRIYDLGLVPLHHDEGVNGNFLVRLVREGFYQYDPQNYHGPTLYYLAAIIPWTLRLLFGPSAQNTYGLTTVTIRLVPAVFGVATTWLVLLLRRRLGAVGTLFAAGLIAISPGAVYLSRYFIHESLFVFFTLGMVVASLRYYETSYSLYLVLAAVSAGLLFATKETFIITAPVLVLALVATLVYRRLRNDTSPEWTPSFGMSSWGPEQSLSYRMRESVNRLGGPTRLAVWFLVAITVFSLVSGLFYSSFFTNAKGVHDAFKTFQVWTKTGQKAHVHEWWTYIMWLGYQEGPLLGLGALGAVIVVWKPTNSFALFSGFWGFGLLSAYSLVPYKTPWLTLNFIIPLALVSGQAIQAIYDYGKQQLRLVIAAAVLVSIVSGYQTADLNFFNYDNDNAYYVYVYAHTRRETLRLVSEIDRIARVSGTGAQTGVTIVSPEYWPLPWYLRDYHRAGYFGRMTTSSEPIIIGSEGQGAEIEANFGARYSQVNSGLNSAGSYALRPGVNLILYARRDLMGR